tara:strand:- start:1595 stop:1906 length:312 start_codon:yes stop_codon:yes gene_type:complete
MIIYVDIDGTICSDCIKNKDGEWDYSLSEPRYEQILKINHLYMEGNEIVYWTARGGTTKKSWRTFTKRQIDNWGCQYTRIEIRKKPQYDLFIDDKSKRIEELT